ncbi:MaoC family dehydratase [Candidatus Parcubacteria bacterium]|nr:MAG: MaoC family dehydratase [Candidatus Parcubacteria bacterium]
MTGVQELTLDDIRIGDTARLTRTVAAADIDAFAALSGDMNPLHVDDAYATDTPFGKRVVHGFFLGALVSQLIGMQLPGKHALLMKETLEFKQPVFIGDTVQVDGAVTSISTSANIVAIDITVRVGDRVVATGVVHSQVRTIV